MCSFCLFSGNFHGDTWIVGVSSIFAGGALRRSDRRLDKQCHEFGGFMDSDRWQRQLITLYGSLVHSAGNWCR